jgi:hypothetical protein
MLRVDGAIDVVIDLPNRQRRVDDEGPALGDGAA